MAGEQLLHPGENLLLYGPTNAGKSDQLKKLILASATKDKPARVYTAREPSTVTHLRPLVDKGLCELEAYHPSLDPFIWIDNATKGNVYREGKWVPGSPEKLCLVGYESLSGFGDLVLNALGVQAANGSNVGGEPAPGLKIQAQGQNIMVPSGSRTHYLVAQRWLLSQMWESQNLSCPQVWTAHEDIVGLDKKTADGEKNREHAASLGIRGIIGPMVAGSALTAGLAKYFVFTFRLTWIPAETSNRHVLYTGAHKDGDLQGLANARCDVPVRQEPSDVVAMLRLIRQKIAAV